MVLRGQESLLEGSLFSKEWFSWHALNGIHAATHGRDVAGHERRLIVNLLAQFLYHGEGMAGFSAEIEFAARGVLERERSFSQILQDLWVVTMTGSQRNGFFVEFGACDGVTLSNTLLLERDYGWSGILAEPNPVWHDRLREERNCFISDLCVHRRSGERVGFSAVRDMPELSRIEAIVPSDIHESNGNRVKSNRIDVETISLNDLLNKYDAPRQIDYLSVDTEGSEFDILEEFNFQKYNVHLITVEHAGEGHKREKIKRLLESHDYSRWNPELSRWDDWYVSNGALTS